jgi:hypothetical protein
VVSDDENGTGGHGGNGASWGARDQEIGPETQREMQARETMALIRESAGDLGARVRQALDHATSLWDETHPGLPESRHVVPEDDLYARTLARRWVERDFLVDPDLPAAMTVVSVERAAVWRIELRERGEARTVGDGREPYKGQRASLPGPLLPVWDYELPFAPDIESGERRERVAGSEAIAACEVCNATGHVACAACDGKGFIVCPTCHGRSRVPCRRCHGRARIPDPAVARKAGAAKSYVQVRAERLATGAGERLADFSERLRQDYGVPLPPSARWAPGASVPEADTIPCPDCADGTVACDCRNGKRVCDVCRGTSAAPCPGCGGTGKVIQYRQIVRRFDTHVAHRTLPIGDGEVAAWVRPEMMRRASGEDVWQSDRDAPDDDAPDDDAPDALPAEVWRAVREFAAHQHERTHEGDGGRRVIGRTLRVTRIPVTRVEYGFAAKPFAFVAVGGRGKERFWAEAFPPRWSRVGRFFRALTRDLQGESRSITPADPQSNGAVSSIEAYRQRRVLGPANTEDAPGSEG